MKPCAHVTCKTCTDSLVRPAKQCIVCDKQLNEKDIIELKREGNVFFPWPVYRLIQEGYFYRNWICRRWYGRDIEGGSRVPGLISSSRDSLRMNHAIISGLTIFSADLGTRHDCKLYSENLDVSEHF